MGLHVGQSCKCFEDKTYSLVQKAEVFVNGMYIKPSLMFEIEARCSTVNYKLL
jgi:hypothetical protein